MRYALAIAFLATAATSSARPGANHHLGDDSFVATFHRVPTPLDGEALRMHTHLVYVRDLLAARPATRPELAERRTQLLGYLDDYIATSTTPKNTYVAWRNPVFIDASGNICAVGYLIERDVGRKLAEEIAELYRLEYLETIAKRVPAVAAWIDGSGFTLEELASIQPGYEGPEVQHVDGWDAKQLVDGAYDVTTDDGYHLVGAFEHKEMTGAWKRTNKAGAVVGSGTFKRGAGTWTSFRGDGTKLAQGSFEQSKANGTWKIFFPDGKVAATGAMKKGKRAGTWTFYYDDAKATVLARGPFADGQVVGPWKHYNDHGKLVATATGKPWGSLTLDIEPGPDGVRHLIDQGIPASSERLDGFIVGSDRFYVENGALLYDEHGYQIEKADGAWHARDCKWSAKKKSAARAGDVAKLHHLLMQHDEENREECSAEARKFTAAEIKRLDKVLATRSHIHAPIPNIASASAFVEPAKEVGQSYDEETSNGDKEEHVVGDDNPDDMTTFITRNMTWYMEWPYVDQPFVAVYLSLPGYRSSEGRLRSCQYGGCES